MRREKRHDKIRGMERGRGCERRGEVCIWWQAPQSFTCQEKHTEGRRKETGKGGRVIKLDMRVCNETEVNEFTWTDWRAEKKEEGWKKIRNEGRTRGGSDRGGEEGFPLSVYYVKRQEKDLTEVARRKTTKVGAWFWRVMMWCLCLILLRRCYNLLTFSTHFRSDMYIFVCYEI